MNVLSNRITIEITSADVQGLFEKLKTMNIHTSDIKHINDLVLRITVDWKDYQKILSCFNNIKIRIISASGLYHFFKGMKYRTIPVLVLLIIVLLTVFLPTRILFIHVSGCEELSERYILEKAAECGIVFGCSRKNVRSETVKNALIEAVPQINWAAVTTSGCTATVHIKENEQYDKSLETPMATSIVAARDGIVDKLTVTQGTALCGEGDAVREGQTLVSGYTDCGIAIKVNNVKAEIYAKTIHHISAVSLSDAIKRVNVCCQKKMYSIQVGKKLIKLYKGSGISGAECAKIKMKYYVQMPGGHILPLTVIQEQFTCYDRLVPVEEAEAQWIHKAAEEYLTSQMVGGVIRQKEAVLSKTAGFHCLLGTYSCTEMIGLGKNEEISRNDAQNN